MARNQEKAMSTLNRWVDQRRVVESGSFERVSARFPGECRSVKEAESGRSQIVRKLVSLISQIQNASLGEQRIRDLNDEINKLLRTKYAWEMQILKLGGPDYRSLGAGLNLTDGAEIPGQRGYKYFGAAKDLPDVRELLHGDEQLEAPRKTRKELMKNLTPDYYGWKDEHDHDLLISEHEAEGSQSVILSPPVLGPISLLEDGLHVLWFAEVEPMRLDRVLLEHKKQSLLATYLNRPNI